MTTYHKEAYVTLNLKLETCCKLFWVRTEKETERCYCRKLGQAFDIRNTFWPEDLRPCLTYPTSLTLTFLNARPTSASIDILGFGFGFFCFIH